jgi:nucleoside 2-deoxyribosyltransferase
VKVYLAGPIAGMSDEQAGQWRDDTASVLGPGGIETIDPFKLRDFRGTFGIADLVVVEPDKADIDSCEAVLANCHIISVGTSMEILYAWERGKFIVVVVPDPHRTSPWIRYHAHFVTDQIAEAWWEISEFKSMGSIGRATRLKRTVR